LIFENEDLAFLVLDVLYLDQGNIKTYNHGRNFDALSFRYKADVTIEYQNKQIELVDNSICFFPAVVNYTRIAKEDKLIVIHFKTFNYLSNEIEEFHPTKPQKYRALFEEMLNCWNAKGISYKHETASILNRIFAELYKDNKKAQNSTSKIYRSIQYIEENCYKKEFSLLDAVKKSYISETYFRKIFEKEYGISPKKYVIKRRIKYATSLIISGYYTLQEVSELCGYNDYKHFSVEFKKVIGVSPSKYTYNYKNTEKVNEKCYDFR